MLRGAIYFISRVPRGLQVKRLCRSTARHHRRGANDTDEALRLSQQAVALHPHAAAPRIALSYAEQARFDLTSALLSVQEATRLEPRNVLAWARLAELWLSTGYSDRALEAASQAAGINLNISRTQTILGYSYLIRESSAIFSKSAIGGFV